MSIPERGLRFGVKIGKRPFWDVGRNFFFSWKKKFIQFFFEVKFPGDYLNVAIIPTLFRDHRQKSKKPNFSLFFDFWPWSRNNHVMIPTTCLFPVNVTLKNYKSKLNFMKKKFFDSQKGSQVWSQNRKTTDLGCRTEFVFLCKKKFIIIFFGVKFTGDYGNVAIIPTLFRDHRQKSKKPNFSLLFRLLTVFPK